MLVREAKVGISATTPDVAVLDVRLQFEHRGRPGLALVEQLVAWRLGAKRGARLAALVLWWWRAWPQLLALVAVRHEIRAGVQGAVRWLEHELRRIRRGIEWQGAVCGP